MCDCKRKNKQMITDIMSEFNVSFVDALELIDENDWHECDECWEEDE